MKIYVLQRSQQYEGSSQPILCMDMHSAVVELMERFKGSKEAFAKRIEVLGDDAPRYPHQKPMVGDKPIWSCTLAEVYAVAEAQDYLCVEYGCDGDSYWEIQPMEVVVHGLQAA